jgi:hypothetical protein
MRKIRQINVGGITGTGQRIDMPVDVYGETWASDEIFNASNITHGAQNPQRDDPEPTQQWPDATFSPQDWDVTPHPPRGHSDDTE